MPKKSRIIVNNWTDLSDEMALFYAHFAFNGDTAKTRWKETSDGTLFMDVFHNKSSVSIDLRRSDDATAQEQPTVYGGQ